MTAETHYFPTRRSSELRGGCSAFIPRRLAKILCTSHRTLRPVRCGLPSIRPFATTALAAWSRSRFHTPLRARSEEHTSEFQSPCNLVCRHMLDKKNKQL